MVNDSSLLLAAEANRGIVNFFTAQKTTLEQETNLLRFRDIGTQTYLDCVKYHILQQPSFTQAPLRHHKLLTMKPAKSSSKKCNPKEIKTRKVI